MDCATLLFMDLREAAAESSVAPNGKIKYFAPVFW